MDQHDQRMECLRMAFELGGKAEPVVSAAQQLLDFLAGTSSTVESRAEQAQVGQPAAHRNNKRPQPNPARPQTTQSRPAVRCL